MIKFEQILVNYSNKKAQLFGNNSSKLSSSLSITIKKIYVLPRITIMEQEQSMTEQILIKPYQVFANELSDSFYVPYVQKIMNYIYFDWNKGKCYLQSVFQNCYILQTEFHLIRLDSTYPDIVEDYTQFKLLPEYKIVWINLWKGRK
ncbi:unnamed protein product [Paramecium octaurelia]|uniref:Uncharacterized protein n=1 Tax=Paramecium octaurelia TaxID=43137 RepID=A0A8S1W2Y0_PAROT|nr:unnamed protein product [Paramecium octaurelia]